MQTALRNVIEPIFERDFAEHSYGFRPGRGCKEALRRVDGLLKTGYTHVVDVDLKSYFDTIPHEPLMGVVREKIADGRVLRLIESFLTQGVMDGLDEWIPTAGSPQGAVISPLLSHTYLDPLDHEMAKAGYEMVRYADDMVILCRNVREAQQALARVQAWTASPNTTAQSAGSVRNVNPSVTSVYAYNWATRVRQDTPSCSELEKRTERPEIAFLHGSGGTCRDNFAL